MTDARPKNVVASIHQRLLNASKRAGRPFNDLAPVKDAKWKGFVRTSRVGGAPVELAEVVALVRRFLHPVAQAIVNQRDHAQQWHPGGPWAER